MVGFWNMYGTQELLAALAQTSASVLRPGRNCLMGQFKGFFKSLIKNLCFLQTYKETYVF